MESSMFIIITFHLYIQIITLLFLCQHLYFSKFIGSCLPPVPTEMQIEWNMSMHEIYTFYSSFVNFSYIEMIT